MNFHSMDYWSKSFGFYLTLGAMGTYIVLVLLFAMIDSYTIPDILAKLIARVKRLELKGFRQKEQKKLTVYRDEKGKIVFIRHTVKKEGEDQPAAEKKAKEGVEENVLEDADDTNKDKVIVMKKDDGPDFDNGKKGQQEDNVAEAYLTPAKMPKGGGLFGESPEASTSGKFLNTKVKKGFKEEVDEESEEVGGKRKEKQGNRRRNKVEEYGDGGYINERGEWVPADGHNADGEFNPYGQEEDPYG